MSYTQAELQAYRDATVPDLLPDPLRLLFIGINPSLWSAATGAHFGRPGNRFYPALHRAGLTRHLLDASAGYRPQDHAELHERGIGISNLVPRATARADELTRQELEAAPARLDAIVAEHAPAVVAVLGVGPLPAGHRPAPGAGRRAGLAVAGRPAVRGAQPQRPQRARHRGLAGGAVPRDRTGRGDRRLRAWGTVSDADARAEWAAAGCPRWCA